jgi:hypothetical protein
VVVVAATVVLVVDVLDVLDVLVAGAAVVVVANVVAGAAFFELPPHAPASAASTSRGATRRRDVGVIDLSELPERGDALL